MKAWFVMKDGEVVGNPLGYKDERRAKNYIDYCDDHSDKWFEYSQVKYGKYNGAKEIPEELKESRIFVHQCSLPSFFGMHPLLSEGWYVSYPFWEMNVWEPYAKEHYEVREREYEIVFKN
jgi:hypothetical protein